MTKHEIIAMIVTILIGSLFSSVEKYIRGKYMPHRKKLNSYIIKFFLFTFRYLFSIAVITYLMIWPVVLDKFFVFAMVLSFSSLCFNVCVDLNLLSLKPRRLDHVILESFKDQLDTNTGLHDYSNLILDKMKFNETRIDRLESEIKILSERQ